MFVINLMSYSYDMICENNSKQKKIKKIQFQQYHSNTNEYQYRD